MRFLHFVLVVLSCLFAFASTALAQNPAVYPSVSQSIPATYNDNDCNGIKVWKIQGPNGLYLYGPTSAGGTDHTGGWQVVVVKGGASFTITPPANASVGAYTVNYGTSQTGSAQNDSLTFYGPGADFNVVSPTPKPAAGVPAFSWQGSVGGVNTGNGNKTTAVPITGWTQRGGIGVSCTLYHNSQGPNYAAYGYKWLVSYLSYISGGSSAPVLHWDNGLVESFTLVSTVNGVSTYNSPYGILDKLTYSNGAFTLTTTGNTVYAFGYVSSNAYLTSITDMDGNTLSIGHNSDTTISTVTDATGRKLTYTYSGGLLRTITDPLGRQWGLGYVSGSYLATIQLPPVNGLTYSLGFGYGDGRQNITQYQDARGNSSFYTYNSDNSLATAKDALGNQTTFTYNPTTTVITDPNGNQTTHTYQYSRLVMVTDALGNTSSTGYDYNNIVTSTTDKRGKTSYFSSHFSNGSSTSTSTTPLGFSSSVTYSADGKNKVTHSVDALNNATDNTYSTDGKDDLLTTSITGTGTAPFKATSKVGGYTNGLPTTFTDPLNFSSSVGYDAYGNVTSATDANNNTSTSVPNLLGWKMSSTDANNHTTTNTYDNWGRVTAVTAPDNTQTTLTYDLDGNVLKAADANAAPLSLSGSATWTTGIGGAALSLNGSANTCAVAASNPALGNFGVSDFTVSLWVRTTSAAVQALLAKRGVQGHSSFWNVYLSNGVACMEVDGDTSGTNYLSLGGNRHVNDGNWHHLTFVRSGATLTAFVDGTQDATVTGGGTAALSSTSPLAFGETLAYAAYYFIGAMDEARVYNRALSAAEITSLAQNTPVASTANQLQSYWHFDEAGGATAFDACHTVTNVYDADDRLVQTTNGRGDVVSYTYDGTDPATGASQKGLLSSKTDGNNHTTRYSYSARDEPLATYYPDGTSESVTYDANGNTQTRTKADGVMIQYTYDADNRLTDITYPHLHATHFAYDADGRKTQMTDATGTTNWSYTYDGVHLSQQLTPQGTVNYLYDGDGRRTQRGIAGQPYAWAYAYDNAGRLHTLQSPSDGTTTYVYDAANRLVQKTKGNGEYETYAYDTANQMTGLGFYWGDGTYRNGIVYTYDPAGNVQTANQGFYTATYGYDGADQQTSENSQGQAFNVVLGYTYDHNGNRLTQSQYGQPYQSFTYDAHDKLTSGTGETDGYDPNGNQTSIAIGSNTSARIFDDEDRLTSITISGGVTNTFTYNGLGLRVGKTDSTGSYAYICDGTTPGSPVLSDGAAFYTPGLSENRGGTSRYYDFDRIGNLWTIDGAGKSQLNFEDMSGFGVLTAGSQDVSPYAFSGGNGCQTDADTGLVLMGHRYFDPRTGRFITQDPAGDGDNWYAYAGNNPVNNTDPSGLVIAGGGFSGMFQQDFSQLGTTYDPNNNADDDYHNGVSGEYNDYNAKTGAYLGSEWVGAPAFDKMNGSSMGPGFMMPARGGVGDSRGQDGLNQLIQDAIEKLNKGGISKAERTATQKGIKELRQAFKATEKADGDRASRVSKENMEAPGERAARNAANAERRAAFQAEQQSLQADAEVATLELDAAEAGVAIDEAAILLGVIVK